MACDLCGRVGGAVRADMEGNDARDCCVEGRDGRGGAGAHVHLHVRRTRLVQVPAELRRDGPVPARETASPVTRRRDVVRDVALTL